MKQLEGDVLEVLAELGGQEALAMETMSVHPKNFLGLELNPRAAAIAELVLWLGYLQWQLRNGGIVSDPVLERLDNIRAMDAVLRHDGERPKADGSGTELANPRRPDWPEADYIVGNPPFIGGKDVRGRLGDAYATALWKAHPRINKSADFVMYWWDRAADQLGRTGTRLKRFGFVTTNSITQEFSRRVISRHLDDGLSLVMAIPDHPWTKAAPDSAAVRIAMTVAQGKARQGKARQGKDGTAFSDGRLYEIVEESGLDTDAPTIEFRQVVGALSADLTVGADVTSTKPLLANEWLCSRGVSLHGAGFIVSPAEAQLLGLERREGLERHIRPYRNGRDLTARPRSVMVIDLLGLDEADVRRRYPEVYQHLLVTVKPERDANNRATYRDNWWIFGEPRRELRPMLAGLSRYIATVETAKHRVFQFLDAAVLPDNKLVCIGFESAYHLGVISSRLHLAFTQSAGGLLEDRPVYVKSSCFDPFPFPDAAPDQRIRIGAIAEELDATRKEVLAEHPDLTLTTLYNLRDKLAKGEAFSAREEDQRMRGRVDILAELHDRLDAAVADAYGWPADLPDEEIVARLVALNAQRAAEERRGIVRWLRPDYQQKKAGVAVLEKKAQPEQIEAMLPDARAAKPGFPRDAIGQTAAVLADLRLGGSLTAEAIAARYSQGRRLVQRIQLTLDALERLGHVAGDPGGYRLRRAA
ncbi:MAG TPA: DNA methyltransferase, partial [Allosphingosinicella sp.]|jgi:hypothetical protein